MTRADKPVVIFDGDCALCSGSVKFVIQRDRHRNVLFGTSQSDAGRALLIANGIHESTPSSVVVIDGNRVLRKSTAALFLTGKLPQPWPLLRVFYLVPRPIRDWIYDQIARNRYRFFGRRDSCMVPTPELRDRFI